MQSSFEEEYHEGRSVQVEGVFLTKIGLALSRLLRRALGLHLGLVPSGGVHRR